MIFKFQMRYSGLTPIEVEIAAELDAADPGARLKAAMQVVVDGHAKWLRGEDDGTRADLRGADLRGADLRGADLRGAVLTRAVLTGFTIPVIENIDAAILGAIKSGGALNMCKWHTCGTAHCRAGWAIVLAGEAGADLEAKVGPAAAGALIYAVSRPGKPIPNFYARNEDAMASIRADAARAEGEATGRRDGAREMREACKAAAVGSMDVVTLRGTQPSIVRRKHILCDAMDRLPLPGDSGAGEGGVDV